MRIVLVSSGVVNREGKGCTDTVDSKQQARGEMDENGRVVD